MLSEKDIKALKKEFRAMSENVFVRVENVDYGIRIAKIKKDAVQALNSGQWIPFSKILSYYAAWKEKDALHLIIKKHNQKFTSLLLEFRAL